MNKAPLTSRCKAQRDIASQNITSLKGITPLRDCIIKEEILSEKEIKKKPKRKEPKETLEYNPITEKWELILPSVF